ncbi:MAG: AzlD domain-containing protein [Clostridiales bacterium]|jgi:branched-subunit amino acid transport protein|nr:AzlD domain-containing protein [Clostridiales bacterium]
MNPVTFFIYLAVMAGTTYLVRMIPFVLFRRKLKNRRLIAFFEFIPYTVLAAMTLPAMLFSTGNIYSAIAGFIAAMIFSILEKSLLTVAIATCLATLAVELVFKFGGF